MVQKPDHRERAVHEFLDACLRGDAETVLEAVHPDIEVFFDSELMPGGSEFRGHAGVRRYFAAVAEAGMEMDVTVEEIRVRGDRVLVIQRTAAQTPDGAGFGARSGAVWTYADGLIRRIDGYLDARQAESVFDAA